MSIFLEFWYVQRDSDDQACAKTEIEGELRREIGDNITRAIMHPPDAELEVHLHPDVAMDPDKRDKIRKKIDQYLLRRGIIAENV